MGIPFVLPGFGVKKTILSGVLMVVLLGGLGGGVYLTQHGTSFLPRAENRLPILSTNLVLETPKADVALGEVFPVDIVVHSDVEAANLFAAKLEYPASLKVVRVATNSAQANSGGEYFVQKWLKIDINNSSLETNIIGGVPNPGLLTDSNSPQKMILATVFFVADTPGSASISIAHSGIFRNEDNQNILSVGQSLNLTVDQNGDPNASNEEIKPTIENPPQPLLAPQGGEIIGYNTPFRVVWDQEINDATIALLLNGQFLGNLQENLPKTSFYIFTPSQKIPLAYLNRTNTFQFRVTGKLESGQIITYQNDEPFEILLNAQTTTSSALDLLNKLRSGAAIDNSTASLLLTSYNSNENLDKVDFNQDGFVNEIDLWFVKNLLKL
jgi:hypothetical protein